MKYCRNCQQMVEPKRRDFSVLAFVILLFLGVIPGIIYLIYHSLKSKKCPLCNGKNWGKRPQEAQGEQLSTNQFQE